MTARLAPCGLHYRGFCICAEVHEDLANELARVRKLPPSSRKNVAWAAQARSKHYGPRLKLGLAALRSPLQARELTTTREREKTAAARQRAAEAAQRAKVKLEADRKARIDRQAHDIRSCATCGVKWCRLAVTGANAKYCSTTCAEAKWHGKKSA